MNRNARGNVREIPVSDLAQRVREHYAMFCACVQAAKCDERPGDATTTAMLELAASHRRRVGELILAGRKRLAARDDWTRWLRESCRMHERLAEYLVRFAPDASTNRAPPEKSSRRLPLKQDGIVTAASNPMPDPPKIPSKVA